MFYLRNWSRDEQFPDRPKLTQMKLPVKKEKLQEFIEKTHGFTPASGELEQMEIAFGDKVIVPRGPMSFDILKSINHHLYQQNHLWSYKDIFNNLTRKYSKTFVWLLNELPIKNARHLEYTLEYLREHPLSPKPLVGSMRQGYWELGMGNTKNGILLGFDRINESEKFKYGDSTMLEEEYLKFFMK